MDTNIRTAPAPAQATPDDESNRFILAGLSAFLRWIEDFITAISGFVLTAALGIGVVDLLSDGQLTANAPAIDYVYAISMALGIGGQMVGTSYRVRRAWENDNKGGAFAYAVLVALLAYVEYISGIVYAYHKSFGESVVQSLAGLGLTQREFVDLRTFVAVALVVLSGLMRYSKPQQRKSIEQEERESQERMRRAAMKQRERDAAIKGVMGTFGTAAQGARQAAADALGGATEAPALAENTPPAARTVQTASNGHDASSRLPKLPQDYTADDPAFDRYELPNGITLTSMYSLSEMARRLGLSKSTLSTAWSDNDMEYEVATGDQPSTAMNLQVYQVLALVETGNLNTPANVRVLAVV